jgi:hypothetical protein
MCYTRQYIRFSVGIPSIGIIDQDVASLFIERRESLTREEFPPRYYIQDSTLAIFPVHRRPRKSPGAVPHAIPGSGYSPGAGGDAVSAEPPAVVMRFFPTPFGGRSAALSGPRWADLISDKIFITE